MSQPVLPEGALAPVPVLNGMETQVETAVDLTGSFLVQKGKESEITSNVTLSENVEAPSSRGRCSAS